MKTLDGQDVYEQGDGWVFYGREQAWYYEPGLLTMPAAPLGTRIANEKKRLSTGWPSLREAWVIQTNQSPHILGVLLAKAIVLCAPAYILWHIPVWIHMWNLPSDQGLIYSTSHPFGYRYGEAQVTHAGQLCVLALFCLWLIWFDHLRAVDKHKANVVTAAVLGAVVVSKVNRRVRAFDQAMDRINHRRG